MEKTSLARKALVGTQKKFFAAGIKGEEYPPPVARVRMLGVGVTLLIFFFLRRRTS